MYSAICVLLSLNSLFPFKCQIRWAFSVLGVGSCTCSIYGGYYLRHFTQLLISSLKFSATPQTAPSPGFLQTHLTTVALLVVLAKLQFASGMFTQQIFVELLLWARHYSGAGELTVDKTKPLLSWSLHFGRRRRL